MTEDTILSESHRTSVLHTPSGDMIVALADQFVTISRRVGEGYIRFVLPRMEAVQLAQEILHLHTINLPRS